MSGTDELRSWDSVTSIGATIVSQGATKIFVLALNFDDVRTFVIGEIEAAWPQPVELLHTCLCGVGPFSSWDPRLVTEPEVAVLFEREP